MTRVCQECGLPMKEGYYSTRGSWHEEKSMLKLIFTRKFDRTGLRNAQSWRCEKCHLILFRY